MPLVLFCGIPSSGKTRRALELKKYLEDEHKCNVVLINEENLSMDKKESYKDPTNEKMTRGFLRSNVEKNLSSSTVTILDSMNYIKGFRYELFCLARTAKSTHCVVYMDIKKDKAKEYNEKHDGGLPPDMFEDYSNRMETPNAKSNSSFLYQFKDRWDSPLFQVRDYEDTPCAEIAQVILFEEKKSKDPVSTKQDIKLDSNFTQELDKRVQYVIDTIVEKQGEGFIKGMSIPFENCKKKLTLNSLITLIELKKFKKEFLTMCKQNPVSSLDSAGDTFVTYLEAVLQR